MRGNGEKLEQEGRKLEEKRVGETRRKPAYNRLYRQCNNNIYSKIKGEPWGMFRYWISLGFRPISALLVESIFFLYFR